MKKLFFFLQLVPAVILLQTLYFKFTGAPESVWIFSQLGVEPWGRYASGIAELFAAALLLYTPTRHWGALTALGVMGGAIVSHLFILGVEVQNDRGLLFALAVLTAGCSLIISWLDRQKIKLP